MDKETEPAKKEPLVIERIFEQPPDATSFYCDLAQIFTTGKEIVLQFYDTIPGVPGPSGTIGSIRTRLRTTITFSIPHAENLGKLLVERTKPESK